MTVMLGSNPNLLLIRGGRIVGRVQLFAKQPNLTGSVSSNLTLRAMTFTETVWEVRNGATQ